MSMAYLELTEDQMVEELAAIQVLARQMVKAGGVRPYDEMEHEKACKDVTDKMLWLARCGDIV